MFLPVSYILASTDNPLTSQRICTAVLSMFMSENLKLREQRSEDTTDFLAGQLEESKRKLDQQDAQLAAFKGKYLGQLPTDEQRNLEMLTATRTRLESLNQELSQAQQQKIIQESALCSDVSEDTHDVGGCEPQRHAARAYDSAGAIGVAAIEIYRRSSGCS